MRRKGSEVVSRLCTLAVLAALGFVLMAYARIPYPPAPWLMIEFSEVTVLIAYALYSWSGALTVAIIKTALDIAVHGLTDPFGIGHITALLTSFFYILSLFLFSHVFKWFRKGKFGLRVAAYVITCLFVSLMMTFLNGLFITPSYVTAYGDPARLSTCFDSGAVAGAISALGGEGTGQGVYWGLIFTIYLPFNLLKSASCCAIYELLFQRLIFVLAQRSPFFQKYFMGSVFKKKEPIADKGKEIAPEEEPKVIASTTSTEEPKALASTAQSTETVQTDNK